MEQKIKNIVFDLGGVVCDIDIDYGVSMLEQLGIEGIREQLNRYRQHGVFSDLETGVISPSEFCAVLRELSGKPYLSDNQIINGWNSIVTGFPKERLRRLLELKKRYNTFLLSNTNACHYDYFPHLLGFYKLEDFFNQIFLSYKLGLCKPDKTIFEHVLQEAGIVAQETLFIDDSAANIASAADLGFQTFHEKSGSDWMSLPL